MLLPHGIASRRLRYDLPQLFCDFPLHYSMEFCMHWAMLEMSAWATEHQRPTMEKPKLFWQIQFALLANIGHDSWHGHIQQCCLKNHTRHSFGNSGSGCYYSLLNNPDQNLKAKDTMLRYFEHCYIGEDWINGPIQWCRETRAAGNSMVNVRWLPPLLRL